MNETSEPITTSTSVTSVPPITSSTPVPQTPVPPLTPVPPITSVTSVEDSLKFVNKLYDNLSYFDLYFSSVLLFFVMTIFVVLVYVYCSAMRNSKQIKNNWSTEKCKPNVIPFAGFINKPENESVMEFTRKNFYECVTNVLSGNLQASIKPFNINGIIDSAKSAANGIDLSFNDVNMNFLNISDFIGNQFAELKNKMANVMIPIQRIMYAVKDTFARMEGVITSAVYTSMANSYLLKSMISEMVKFICSIFYSLIVVIAMMFVIPGTQGLAVAASAVAIALSTIFVSTNISLGKMFHIKPGKMPKIPKCFDENTLIEIKTEGDRKTEGVKDVKVVTTKIKDIQVGDVLKNGATVTAKFKLGSTNVHMYSLHGTIVSDCHQVWYNSEWIQVLNHPDAIELDKYDKPFIYCLNTENKTIQIGDDIYLDWDEIYEKHLEKLIFKKISYVNHKSDIHKYLDGGFYEKTPISLLDYSIKRIKDVKIGDVLLNGEIVYGIVEIKGDDLIQVNKYNLGHTSFKGGPNLNMIQNNKICSIAFDSPNIHITQISNPTKLYHLLTDQRTFYVGAVKMCDYNSLIDDLINE